MEQSKQYVLVDAEVLPEVYLKVLEAKQLLARGKAKSLSQAAQMAGLSRTAFYKYKDHVFSYQQDTSRQIATVYAELVDEPGVLSSVLAALHKRGANILTINQNIPVDGVAPVSISMRTERLEQRPQALVKLLTGLDGVVSARILSG